jgi:hypothetical protein
VVAWLLELSINKARGPLAGRWSGDTNRCKKPLIYVPCRSHCRCRRCCRPPIVASRAMLRSGQVHHTSRWLSRWRDECWWCSWVQVVTVGSAGASGGWENTERFFDTCRHRRTNDKQNRQSTYHERLAHRCKLVGEERLRCRTLGLIISVVLATFLTLALYLDRLVMRFQVVIVRFVSYIDSASVGVTLQSHMISSPHAGQAVSHNKAEAPAVHARFAKAKATKSFCFSAGSNDPCPLLGGCDWYVGFGIGFDELTDWVWSWNVSGTAHELDPHDVCPAPRSSRSNPHWNTKTDQYARPHHRIFGPGDGTGCVLGIFSDGCVAGIPSL